MISSFGCCSSRRIVSIHGTKVTGGMDLCTATTSSAMSNGTRLVVDLGYSCRRTFPLKWGQVTLNTRSYAYGGYNSHSGVCNSQTVARLLRAC